MRGLVHPRQARRRPGTSGRRRLAGALAAVLMLAACTGAPADPDATGHSASPSDGGTVTVMEAAALTSFNPSTVTGQSDINTKIAYATHAGFTSLTPELTVVHDEGFGTLRKISDDPLTVKYTIHEGVTWSDGTPVSAADLLLEWAAGSGYYDDATLDDDFNVASGTSYFHHAGDLTALSQTELPVMSDDGASLTLRYTTPVADWETALGSRVTIPAHIVASRAGLPDVEALNRLFQETRRGDPAAPRDPLSALSKVAAFWNTGFDTRSMPDPSLALSNGPYLVRSLTAGSSVVLTRNPDYAWGAAATLDSITVSYAPDPQAQLTALANGAADVISTPPTPAALTALAALSEVTVSRGNSLDFDAVVLNFTGDFAQADIRQAFLHTVPRREILAELVTPVDPAATVLDSLVFRSAQAGYRDAARVNGSAAYAAVDLELAATLLAGATPSLRILYNRDDPLRAREYQLVAASATRAGFVVHDAGADAASWQAQLRAGDYDAALIGWHGSAAGVGQVASMLRTGATANPGRFSNAEVDRLVDQLALTIGGDKQEELLRQIDTLALGSGYGLPLFEHPALTAAGPHISGVRFSAAPVGVWWNVARWQTVS